MPIWDAVALGLAGSGTNPELNGVPLINNSYNCYVGSVLAFYIGEGRVTAIYGGETKLVFDWESVLFKLLDGAKIPFSSRTLPVSTGLRKVMGGGDTTLVLGPTNKLNYYGADLAIGRTRDKFELNYQSDNAGKNQIPPVIQSILALGFLGILAISLLLRYWWGFYGISSTKPQTEQEQLASVLIPMFEGLWLTLLYAAETVNGVAEGMIAVAVSLKSFLDSASMVIPCIFAAVAAVTLLLSYAAYQTCQFALSSLARLTDEVGQSLRSLINQNVNDVESLSAITLPPT
jgi:hypothetical protein